MSMEIYKHTGVLIEVVKGLEATAANLAVSRSKELFEKEIRVFQLGMSEFELAMKESFGVGFTEFNDAVHEAFMTDLEGLDLVVDARVKTLAGYVFAAMSEAKGERLPEHDQFMSECEIAANAEKTTGDPLTDDQIEDGLRELIPIFFSLSLAMNLLQSAFNTVVGNPAEKIEY